MERRTIRIGSALKASGRRWVWLAALALVGCSSAVLLYSSETHAPRSARPGPLMLSAVAPAPAPPVMDLADFMPYLAEPRFNEVKDALESEQLGAAAAALSLVLATAAESERQSLGLWLGWLWQRAADAPRALAACQAAMQAPGPLLDYVTLCEARGFLATGQADAAYQRLSTRSFDSPLEFERLVVLAESARVVGKRDQALNALERSLTLTPEGLERARAALGLAELRLVGGTSSSDVEAALLSIRQAAPFIVNQEAEQQRARALEERALAALPSELRARYAEPQADLRLAEIRALVDARKHEQAERQARALLESFAASAARPEDICEANLALAKALAGLRRFGAAAEALEPARTRCNGDGERGARVWYLSGRYSSQAGRPAEAIALFAEVERRFPQHSLADDARFQGAVAQEDIGAQARATELLLSLPEDYPNGDMAAEGLFRLAVRQMERGSWSDALGLLERGLSVVGDGDAKRGFELAGRERYFRARAWLLLGERERGLNEFEQVVLTLPLSYYMLQAYSWLERAEPERAVRAIARAEQLASSEPFRVERRPALETPGFERMMQLLRIGEVEPAMRELNALGLGKESVGSEILWAVAGLYERAGFSKYSAVLTRKRLSEVSSRWPAAAWAKPWEIAFPRPYLPLVQKEAQAAAIDPALVYAIMREESAFDPEAVSPANAFGLMQLILPTARQAARKTNLPVSARSLKRPAVNIALGCRELSRLGQRFAHNPLLAVPAYNAGPGAADRWLRERPALDFDLWVERIPFLETRRYTKRVLSSRAVYTFLYYRDGQAGRLALPQSVVGTP